MVVMVVYAVVTGFGMGWAFTSDRSPFSGTDLNLERRGMEEIRQTLSSVTLE